MNKSQRIRKKRSNESSVIFKGKSENYETISSTSWTFVSCYMSRKHIWVLFDSCKLS